MGINHVCYMNFMVLLTMQFFFFNSSKLLSLWSSSGTRIPLLDSLEHTSHDFPDANNGVLREFFCLFVFCFYVLVYVSAVDLVKMQGHAHMLSTPMKALHIDLPSTETCSLVWLLLRSQLFP